MFHFFAVKNLKGRTKMLLLTGKSYFLKRLQSLDKAILPVFQCPQLEWQEPQGLCDSQPS